jgi:hypothetical protein
MIAENRKLQYESKRLIMEFNAKLDNIIAKAENERLKKAHTYCVVEKGAWKGRRT